MTGKRERERETVGKRASGREGNPVRDARSRTRNDGERRRGSNRLLSGAYSGGESEGERDATPEKVEGDAAIRRMTRTRDRGMRR